MCLKAKRYLRVALWLGLWAWAVPAGAAGLMVYGPGGPLAPMQECARLFAQAQGLPVTVTAGPEENWIQKAKKDADLIFGGAEYMLSLFMLKHPGLVEEKTVASLWVRPAGILVRKQNPKSIKSLKDLSRPGIRLLDVAGAGQLAMWEDLAGKQGLIPGIRRNIAATVPNTAVGIQQWKDRPELDAWINFASWHLRLKEITDLVPIPREQTVYRGTPVAITSICRQKPGALKFIDFLKTPQAHEVFKRWGWE